MEGRERRLVSACPSLLQSLEAVVNISVDVCATEEECELSESGTSAEEAALNAFCHVYQHERRFSDQKHSCAFSKVLSDLVQQRILNGWISETSCDSHMLSVLKVVRLLLRDEHFLSHFMKLGGLPPVVSLLSRLGAEHLLFRGHTPLQVEVLRELTSICQKLSAGDEWRPQLAELHLPLVLYQLLHSTDLCVVQCSLCCLIQFAKEGEGQGEGQVCVEVTQGTGEVDLLFRMVQGFDPTTQHLAADLLSLLAQRRNFTEHFKMANGAVSCLRLLKGSDAHVLQRMVNVLEHLGRDPEMNNDIRVAGGIPLLLHLLQNAGNVVSQPGVGSTTEQGRPSVFELSQSKGRLDQVSYLQSSCCSTVTQLAISDASALAIVQDNGVYVLANFIRPHPSKRVGKPLINLQCHALRALRFLFSLERNRRILRRLFPPDLFESFITIGHYQWDIAAYSNLVDTINTLPESDAASLLESIEALNSQRAPLFTVGRYQVVELLGTGAFGSVYKVRRKTSDQLFAMKEIKITHPSLGKTRLEREKSMGKLLNEVTIMKEQLRHPSVVHYHKTFQESGHLYIIMELLEGASLYEHVSSLKEKGRSFTEEQIWRMFLQLVLALRYIHKEKHIVHRDLSASNVMIGADLSLCLTDFGLAKQKQREMSVMNSVVGTMPYWSPELVQSEPYTEKVDIWAAGCLLYLMAALHPPFAASNPLALATKIVECDYPALPKGCYSVRVSEVITACLTKDPEERPDAIAVGALLAGALMEEVDHLRGQIQSLQRRLDQEKEKAHKHYHEALRARRTSEQLKSVQSLQNSFNFDHEDSPGLIDLEEGPERMPDLAASSDSVFMQCLSSSQGVEPGEKSKTLHSFMSPPSILHVSSLKVGNSVATDNPITQSPVVEGTNVAAHQRSWSLNVSPSEGASPEVLHHRRNLSAALPPLTTGRERLQRHRKSSAGVVAMSPNRLKEISDPILQLMSELHKLIAVTQAPPPTTPHPRRQLVELYKRSLFGTGSKPEDLKTELHKLSSESLEPVERLLGPGSGGKSSPYLSCSLSSVQPKLIAAALGDLHSLPSRPLPVLSTDGATLSYQQLKAIIDSVYQELTA